MPNEASAPILVRLGAFAIGLVSALLAVRLGERFFDPELPSYRVYDVSDGTHPCIDEALRARKTPASWITAICCMPCCRHRGQSVMSISNTFAAAS